MSLSSRVETALRRALPATEAPGTPKLLGEAMRHAVFPGGARVRPTLCLAVAQACGDDRPALAEAAAAAIELLHCASLAHDDLPCFDNAALRRGRPSVHAAFGEPLALLAGDALIVAAFEGLAAPGVASPQRLVQLISVIAAGVNASGGIIAGQAWESEVAPPLHLYHQAKTGSLFVAAAMAGAAAAGADANAWRLLGAKLGEAYQIADDLLDASPAEDEAGKPIGRDAALGRPNAVIELGLSGAAARLDRLVADAVEAVPTCLRQADMRDLVRSTAMRLAPKHRSRSAAA